ncbi:hypothetical protein DL764_000983 [Monosporascus ibericus]|uniref:Extracellular membrane protein CFEM domain-containing protein n=1 Tax=Monosporascus ibericus TaxID=155417 RepID=A0A4Q4TRH8_9PEZI|nr:hypothetical protein DL764_000983 [Monosporascus ibericus]
MKTPHLSIIATAAALAFAVADPSPVRRRSVDCRNSDDTYERFMNCYNDRAVRCQTYTDKSECFLANRGECGSNRPGRASEQEIWSCITFDDAARGFTDKKQPGNFTFTRNTAWNNAQVGCQTVVWTSRLISNIASVNAKSTENANYISLMRATTSSNLRDASATWINASLRAST